MILLTPSQKFVVTKLLEGIKRSKQRVTDSRLPITKELLLSLMNILPFLWNSKYELILFKAVFSLAYGLLRIGELAISNGQKNHTISIYDVLILPNNLIKMTIPSSKTNQLGNGCHIVLQRNQNTDICPVTLLTSFLNDRPQISSTLFCHYNGRPLTRFQFVAVLKKSLERVGVNYKSCSSHSFRIGWATSLSIEGVTDHIVMQLGP